MTADHPAVALWEAHEQVHPYPNGVIAVRQAMDGPAFFPGGYGLVRPMRSTDLPRWPLGGIMILGHDFHSQAGYEQSVMRGGELPNQPTWRNLNKLLNAAEIDATQCFFTNVYMGLREGEGTTGPFPGRLDAAFVARCTEFLHVQLAAQDPRLVIVMGRPATEFLANALVDLASWRFANSFEELDTRDPVRTGVRLQHGRQITVVPIVHPSLRHLSINRRTFQGQQANDAELRLLTHALHLAGIRPIHR